MADTITTQTTAAATLPDATVIATDDAGASGHVQRIKLAYSADGVATAIDADAQGLQVKRPVAAAAALANVAAGTASTSVLAAQASRKGVILANDSVSALYLKYGGTASVASFTVKIPANGYWEMPDPVYVGAMTGVWDTAAGTARVTELT